MSSISHSPLLRLAATLGVICLLASTLLLFGADASIAGDKTTKIERQIDVMEGAIDDMLVDSPNFLVAGRHVTDGFDIDDYGVLFTFEASLTGLGWHDDSGFSLSHFWPWTGGKKHNIICLKKGDGDDKEIEFGDGHIIIRDGDVCIVGDDEKSLQKLLTDGKIETIDDKEYRKRQLEKYEKAKEELIEVFMDYGEILKAVPAGQTVRVVARLHDMQLPKDKEIRKLSLRATIDDLRSYGDGRLSEGELRNRIKIKES